MIHVFPTSTRCLCKFEDLKLILQYITNTSFPNELPFLFFSLTHIVTCQFLTLTVHKEENGAREQLKQIVELHF